MLLLALPLLLNLTQATFAVEGESCEQKYRRIAKEKEDRYKRQYNRWQYGITMQAQDGSQINVGARSGEPPEEDKKEQLVLSAVDYHILGAYIPEQLNTIVEIVNTSAQTKVTAEQVSKALKEVIKTEKFCPHRKLLKHELKATKTLDIEGVGKVMKQYFEDQRVAALQAEADRKQKGRSPGISDIEVVTKENEAELEKKGFVDPEVKKE